MSQITLETPAAEKLRRRFRTFGFLLGILGIWLALPVVINGGKVNDPSFELAGTEHTANERANAVLAAMIGAIRGDLWANAAFTGAFEFVELSARQNGTASWQAADVRSETERALRLAPINGAAWLILALLPAPSPDAEDRINTFLEMSYFTAPYAPELAPRRLYRVTTTSALADKDMQSFVKADLREILNDHSDAEPIILAAYRKASVQNQPILASLVADIDPTFAKRLGFGEAK
ncbi:MAG: hypothetical protein FWC84_00855 [Alphaproteobacteria bacterium]|nr:hypothetical protein [Alphaproteobacteria bacterium]